MNCPKCKQTVDKMKNKGCPHCGVPLQKLDGYLYEDNGKSPAVQVLEYFVALVNANTMKQQRVEGIVFSIDQRSSRYAREITTAKQLLKLADGDIGLVLETWDTMFRNSQFARRDRVSMIGCNYQFGLAMAVTKAIRAKRDKENNLANSVWETVMEKEDIWA